MTDARHGQRHFGDPFDLGQHEMVDDVLQVDVQAAVAEYVTSLYMTTPLSDRADAVYEATGEAEGLASLWSPIAEMENVSGGALPDLRGFLPRWVERLERFGRRKPIGKARMSGRCARRSFGWKALVASSVSHAKRSALKRAWRGVKPLSSERTGRPPFARTTRPRGWFASRRGEANCSMARRWHPNISAFGRCRPPGESLARRALGGAAASVAHRSWPASLTPVLKAKRALKRFPRTDGRQLGLLRALAGDLHEAAAILARAPGLGWSSYP